MQDVKRLLNQIEENLNVLEEKIVRESGKENIIKNKLDETTIQKISNYLNQLDDIIERLDENN